MTYGDPLVAPYDLVVTETNLPKKEKQELTEDHYLQVTRVDCLPPGGVRYLPAPGIKLWVLQHLQAARRHVRRRTERPRTFRLASVQA